MSGTDIRTNCEGLTHLIWEKDREGLTQFIRDIPPADLPLVISRLDSSDRSTSGGGRSCRTTATW